jgi:hypothetical protein
MATTPRKRRSIRYKANPRICELVDAEGGQASFCRKVFGEVARHKGKVWRWYEGRSGVSAREARAIAKKCGVSSEWLLTGEGDRWPGVSRSKAALEDDIAAYVATKIAARLQHASREVHSYLATRVVDGGRILSLAVDREVENLQQAAKAADREARETELHFAIRAAMNRKALDGLPATARRLVASFSDNAADVARGVAFRNRLQPGALEHYMRDPMPQEESDGFPPFRRHDPERAARIPEDFRNLDPSLQRKDAIRAK